MQYRIYAGFDWRSLLLRHPSAGWDPDFFFAASYRCTAFRFLMNWIPAFAGTTLKAELQSIIFRIFYYHASGI